MKNYHCTSILAAASLVLAPAGFAQGKDKDIEITPVVTFPTGIFDQVAAEIGAHDPKSQRVFVTNVANRTLDVFSIGDLNNPHELPSIDLTPYGSHANSVAASYGVVAAAIEAEIKTDPGSVVFFEAATGAFLSQVTVGSEPDMLTFTPNGRRVLVANEAEPNDEYTIDPEGSVSIIDLRRGAAGLTQADVRTADFAAFNGATLEPSVRIFGPNATVAQDLEPEYIAISDDGKTAWVTLQENNAVAILDIGSATFTRIAGLGFKDHSLPGNGLDASDKDGAINIANWPVKGMYQPDAIATFRDKGRTYLITANEGDSRDYSGYNEEKRVKSLVLDPVAFPNAAALQADSAIGRLTVTTANGDANHDGKYEELYAFGARSFSIRDADASLVFDSGDELERITAAAFPTEFNSNNDENGTFDNRSDNKGPEPEGVAIGKIAGRTYGFIGLERIGGIVVYDLSEPTAPRFIQYLNNRDFSGDAELGTAGDLAPEGVLFIEGKDSPTKKPLLVVTNEVSGSTTVYEITRRK